MGCRSMPVPTGMLLLFANAHCVVKRLLFYGFLRQAMTAAARPRAIAQAALGRHVRYLPKGDGMSDETAWRLTQRAIPARLRRLLPGALAPAKALRRFRFTLRRGSGNNRLRSTFHPAYTAPVPALAENKLLLIRAGEQTQKPLAQAFACWLFVHGPLAFVRQL